MAYPATLLVDTGNLAQDRPRLEVVAAAFAEMQYAAVALGPWDTRLSDHLYDVAAQEKLTLLSATVEREGVAPRLVQRFGEFRVGVTAATYGARQEEDIQRLVATLRALREECDLVVLLSQWNLYWDKQFLDRPEAEGLVDILIGNAGAAYLRDVLDYHGVKVLPTSLQGRRVHICEVLFDADKKPQVRLGSRELGPEVEKDEAVQALINEYSQSLAAKVRVKGDYLSREQWRFIAADACHECHPEAFATWKELRHAKALDSLRRAQRLVPQCLKCHSELFARTGKFAELAPEASGIQCVTCHVDTTPTPPTRAVGQAHMDDPKAGNISRAATEQACRRCHLPSFSPKYDYQAFREKIKHWE